MKETLTIRTHKRIEMIDITSQVQRAVDRKGISEGVCVIFVPHTTAAVTINENADPDVPRDIIGHLAALIPQQGAFRHREGNADAHIKVSLTGSSETILINQGRLVLGTWQSLFFCEFDGPRSRKVHLQVIEG
jgi:secondary thiamine-phosphate synthase enzyme